MFFYVRFLELLERLMGLLVRVLMVLCLAAAGFAGGPAEAAKKKQKEPPKPKEAWQMPMTVTIVRSFAAGCEPLCPEWIAAEGEITMATPARFRKILKQAGKKKLPVILNSPGGRMDAAVEIGRMIRKAKLDVAVGWTNYAGCKPTDKDCKLPKDQKGIYRGIVYTGRGFCNSACPVVLAGGVQRLSGPWAYVGVHQVRTTYVQERITYQEKYRIVKGKKKVISRKEVGRKTVKTSQKDGLDKSLRKKLLAYYKEMGISTDIIDDMLKAEFKTIYRLDLNRQEALKLVTSRGTSDLFTSNRACLSGNEAANCILDPQAAGKAPPKTGPIPIPRQKPNVSLREHGSRATPL